MATMTEWKQLIKFSKDAKDFNPNMYRDIKAGIYVPCISLNKTIKEYYESIL